MIRRLLNTILIASGLFMVIWITNCSPVKFANAPLNCSDCSYSPSGKIQYQYAVTPSNTPVDILFVSDNSGSMSRDQRTLGTKFPSFFNIVKNFDYRVAITTTDVFTKTGGTGRGGTLVSFSDGSNFLTRNSSNAQTQFSTAIQRPETATCDSYLASHNCNGANPGRNSDCSDYYNYCPNDDSRGIYAANLVVSNNPAGFLRESAPLHVVIMSNADERVLGGNYPPWPLENLDQPSTLVSRVQSMYNGAKSLRVHTLVIQPGDSSCLSQEVDSNLGTFGQYAPVYASLSSMTSGISGSICASDYSGQLAQIANMVQLNLMTTIPLRCKTSVGSLQYTLSPVNSSIVGTLDSSGMNLNFNQPIPSTSTVTLTYECI